MQEQRTKRKKREQDEAPPAPVTAPALRTFFEVLSVDAVKKVFRFLSDDPLGDDWAACVPQDTTESLLQCLGALYRAARPMFGLWFDTIPDRVVQFILSFLGRKPKRGIWKVPGETALALVRTRRSLSPNSRIAFASVSYMRRARSVPVRDPEVDDAENMVHLTSELSDCMRWLCIASEMPRPLRKRISARVSGRTRIIKDVRWR